MEVINQLKSYGVVIGVMLFLGAVLVSYFSARNLMQIIPEENYVDQGVHIFYPYRVLPMPVKNTSASSRDRRMNPTKTVYVVYSMLLMMGVGTNGRNRHHQRVI